jgi:hypothetical protein
MAITDSRVLPARPGGKASPVAAGRRIVLAAIAIFAVSLIATPVTAAEVSRVDAIAVCPPELRPALTGWMARRGDEGLVIHVVEPDVSAEETRKRIATAAIVGQTRYVILVGDSRLTMQGRPANPRCYLPTIYQRADATAAYQQTVSLPGDYLYGDFDGDGVVNAAVGRLPVGSVAQAAELFDRIANYEQSRDFGRWRSRVDLVAGLGGFGPLIDGAIETVASGMITGSLPGSVRTRVTHAGPDSLFCPGPHCFTDTVLANYDDGARFWVYAGHGHIRELDRVPASQQGRPVLAVDDVTRLRRPADSAPIALLLACYTGAFDATEDCLAKEMLLARGGPIAVLAGSRVTMPYGNAAAAMGLIHAVYHRRPERLGDAWLDTLDEMATPSDAKPDLRSRRVVIDGLATMLGDGRIDAERREHMQLYNWLGDPTLRLCHPDEVAIDPLPRSAAGEVAVITGHATMPGKMTIELHRRLGTQSPAPPVVSPASAFDANTPDAGVERYRLANDTAITTATLRIAEAGPWRAEVAVPMGVSGPMRWVVDLEGPDGFASGSQSTWVRPAGH